MYSRPRYRICGDRALGVEFGDDISPETNGKVRQMVAMLDRRPIPGIIDLVPGYRSLLILFDPLRLSHRALKTELDSPAPAPGPSGLPLRTVTDIPTVYGGEYGPDLETVAENRLLNPDEVVQLHTQALYLVYMIGFLPGFAYLGGLNPRLATPRLKTPRLKTPAGSVGIAGEQTGIYPTDSPGGWRVIGRTPLNLFDPAGQPPALLESGHYVRFVPIGMDQYERIREAMRLGTYQVKRTAIAPRSTDKNDTHAND